MRHQPMIQIERLDDLHFRVTVNGPSQTTHHQVAVRHEYHNQLVGEQVTPHDLVEAAFKFLLRKEPNTSILHGFDLAEIERFFPEFPQEIKDYL